MEKVYSKGHMTRIMGLDAIIFFIGLALLGSPFIKHNFPADIDTTSHVALGALIAVLAAFRMLIAYGSIWIDIVLIAFGIIAFRMPVIMHMQWNNEYNMAHMVLGGAVVGLSVIAMIMTVPVINKKA